MVPLSLEVSIIRGQGMSFKIEKRRQQTYPIIVERAKKSGIRTSSVAQFRIIGCEAPSAIYEMSSNTAPKDAISSSVMARRGKYGRWSVEDMEMALRAYSSGVKCLSQCSRDYGISKSTLLRHIRNTNKIAKGACKRLGRNPTFENDIEKLLCQHIVQFSNCLFGLTIRDIRKLAFDLAEYNNIPRQFNKEKR
ncbi:hypothetical protein NQ318_001792 [Aromia moschata]|uniref:HTH psq-type domain-containing protein n=1 Tax=Aromia moschata TaxID=1265417 RepID=A0AAV8X132_9CUCU|nr:hypothetical protein NQ318_001792 [Aromia moschata]